MIARIWTGVTRSDKGDEFYEYIKRTGVPGLTQTPGNRGVYVLRGSGDNEAHFMMISFWDSFEDIKGFAGEDISQARLYPDDEAFLIRYDARVTHYDLVDFTREQA
jgi:heme-degrading monooxygenase HmoA